mmetsp:Transcript_79303/g.153374  ORF Transcript_79303/g.153374 Transcript_79303/m.153374 type:complete len:119 (-) Transcript_79303:28-384(-)
MGFRAARCWSDKLCVSMFPGTGEFGHNERNPSTELVSLPMRQKAGTEDTVHRPNLACGSPAGTVRPKQGCRTCHPVPLGIGCSSIARFLRLLHHTQPPEQRRSAAQTHRPENPAKEQP